MAMRYTQATSDGIRRAMQLISQKPGMKKPGVLSREGWTDAKVPRVSRNGARDIRKSLK